MRAILNPPDYPQKFDLAVCDASFISTTLLIPAIVPLLAPDARMIVLVKPQFEVGRGQVGRGGIVRDPALASRRLRSRPQRRRSRSDSLRRLSRVRSSEPKAIANFYSMPSD